MLGDESTLWLLLRRSLRNAAPPKIDRQTLMHLDGSFLRGMKALNMELPNGPVYSHDTRRLAKANQWLVLVALPSARHRLRLARTAFRTMPSLKPSTISTRMLVTGVMEKKMDKPTQPSAELVNDRRHGRMNNRNRRRRYAMEMQRSRARRLSMAE